MRQCPFSPDDGWLAAQLKRPPTVGVPEESVQEENLGGFSSNLLSPAAEFGSVENQMIDFIRGCHGTHLLVCPTTSTIRNPMVSTKAHHSVPDIDAERSRALRIRLDNELRFLKGALSRTAGWLSSLGPADPGEELRI